MKILKYYDRICRCERVIENVKMVEGIDVPNLLTINTENLQNLPESLLLRNDQTGNIIGISGDMEYYSYRKSDKTMLVYRFKMLSVEVSDSLWGGFSMGKFEKEEVPICTFDKALLRKMV